MHPLGYARAPPPMRRPSSRSNLTSANPATNSRTLQHKLSSSALRLELSSVTFPTGTATLHVADSLSMSLPPDSPPTTFDEISFEPSNFGTPGSPTRSRTNGDQLGSIKVDCENTPSHQTSNTRIPFPQSSPTTSLRQHARTLSLRSARKAVIEHTGSPTTKGIDVPLSQEWLLSQTRTDLEALLAEADKAIRERQRGQLVLSRVTTSRPLTGRCRSRTGCSCRQITARGEHRATIPSRISPLFRSTLPSTVGILHARPVRSPRPCLSLSPQLESIPRLPSAQLHLSIKVSSINRQRSILGRGQQIHIESNENDFVRFWHIALRHRYPRPTSRFAWTSAERGSIPQSRQLLSHAATLGIASRCGEG